MIDHFFQYSRFLCTCGLIVLFHCAIPASGETASLSIRYDAFGRLQTVDYSSTTKIDYVYDAAGNLRQRAAGQSAAAAISLSLTEYEFSGGVFVGSSTFPTTFTITNTGTGPLHLGVITLGGANPTDFTITRDEASNRSLLAQESVEIDVTFTAEVAGNRSAVVSIPSNDPVTPVATILVSGPAIDGPDIDQDGLPDFWEQQWFASDTGFVAGQDNDNDGYLNITEFIYRSNPQDKTSIPNGTLFTLPIQTGWNLRSLPLLIPNALPQRIFNRQYSGTVFGLDSSGTSPQFLPLAEIPPNTGFWIYFADLPDHTIQLVGEKTNNSYLSLQAGWNLFGLEEAGPAPDVPGISSLIWMWDKTKFVVAHEPLQPGIGYLVFVQ